MILNEVTTGTTVFVLTRFLNPTDRPWTAPFSLKKLTANFRLHIKIGKINYKILQKKYCK